jgi:predicted ATPase/class 3 adenylate cyclase/Tfp pilus assembly protein PilF
VGTVTFVLTDVEASTRLWEAEPDGMRRAIARHVEIISRAIADHGGTLVRERGEGDSTFSAFSSVPAAVAAALACQRALVAEPWPDGIDLRVRVALHTGDAQVVDGEYSAPAINRCARVREVAYGGQVLLSEHAAELADSDLPDGSSLRDLGRHRLRDLSRPIRLYQLQHAEIPEDFPGPRSLETVLHNLPTQLTSFIGRDREINEVRKLLSTTRMLNLTGPGGVGKTRLALQAAVELIETFTDGVWFVDLSSRTDAASIATAVASALSLREQPGREISETLTDHLHSAKGLLILDNCEHIVDASTTFASTMLRSCVELGIVATTREPLRVTGATSWTVPAMAVPDERVTIEELGQYESIRLFSERAALVRPDFALTHETGPIVARICRRLDGVPLAIELAAAAVRALSPAEIDARLDDRFRILVGGGPDVPRHETLRATVDWSYQLLSESEQTLLRRLSAFAGGFTLEGAEAVCVGAPIEEPEIVGLVTALVGKSLITTDEFDDATRYALLETIRDYAAEKLIDSGEEIELGRRHIVHFLRLAERTQAGIDSPELPAVLAALDSDHDNFRRALRFGLVHAPADALALGAALQTFWSLRGHWSEGRTWLDQGLAGAGDVSPELLARGLVASGALAQDQGDLKAARAFFEQSLKQSRAMGDNATIATSCIKLAGVLHGLGDRDDARLLFSEGLDLARRSGHQRSIAAALNGLGIISASAGDNATAIPLYEESVEVAGRNGMRRWMASPLCNLGMVTLEQGDIDRAEAWFHEALQIARETDDRRLMSLALNNLGGVAQDRGDNQRAREFHRESLEIQRRLGDLVGTAMSLYRLGEIARSERRYAEAGELLNESLELWRARGVAQGIAAVLGELGSVARAEGDLDRAQELMSRALTMYQELGYKQGVAASLEGLGGVAVERSDGQRAAQLFGAAAKIREEIGTTLPLPAAAAVDRDIEAASALVGASDFARGVAEGRAMPLEQVVALAGAPYPMRS